ncbi:6,7-dimethyl-8-ribityllumazine synthase [Candidatus Nitrospira bockiana]
MNILEGYQDAKGLRLALVVSKFNEFITERLFAGAVEVLKKAGADDQTLEVVRVPGAFEIPLVARHLALSRRFDAVICLGAVIRGETPHFEYISREASRGIAQAAWDSGVPVIFGVLTTDTVDQALARAEGVEQNRGAEAARTAIEMASVLRALNRRRPRGAAARRVKKAGRPR